MPNSVTRLRAARWIALVGALAMSLAGCSLGNTTSSDSEQRQIVDVLGREVTVPANIDRILLDGAFSVYTLAILNPEDPFGKVVGMPDDFEQNDPDALAHYARKFPQINEIPRVGQIWDESFSVEEAIKRNPQIFLISASGWETAQQAGIIDKLDKAGIPSVVVDYFVDPVKNTVPTVRLVGELLGQQDRAQQFIDTYESSVTMVTSRLRQAREPVTPMFLWRAPGYFDCCSSFSKSNLSQLVGLAGGKNIADDFLDTKQGTVTREAVIRSNPAVIIATGANWASSTPAKPGTFVPLGYAQNPDHARSQLTAIVDRQPGFNAIDAVKTSRTYALWHHFYDTPFNYLAVAWFAKWLHPNLFQDVNPDAMMAQLHEDFLPVPAAGTFWTQM